MEQIISISSARQKLLEITKQIKSHMEKFILTNKGEPQAILLSLPEYHSLLAAAQLLANPKILEQTYLGIHQLNAGNSLTVEQAFEKKAMTAKGKAAALAGAI